MKVYGIPNCNTVKKALDWFKDYQIDIEFHNFKKSGIDVTKLEEWTLKVDWEALLNKRGTTWKMLDADYQKTIISKEAAFKLMQDKPSIIKRPVVETQSGSIILGFDEAQFANLLK
jgi:arsenate reductase